VLSWPNGTAKLVRLYKQRRILVELATIEQESSEEGGEFVVRVEREHVCNMLVRTNDDNRPLLAIDAA
jgi:hypothetical protein